MGKYLKKLNDSTPITRNAFNIILKPYAGALSSAIVTALLFGVLTDLLNPVVIAIGIFFLCILLLQAQILSHLSNINNQSRDLSTTINSKLEEELKKYNNAIINVLPSIVRKDISEIRDDILTERGLFLRAKVEIYDIEPEGDIENNINPYKELVYEQIENEVLQAKKTLRILTVPGMGDGLLADQCKPMNGPIRQRFFNHLQEYIEHKVKNNQEFKYTRIHQVPKRIDISQYEPSNALSIEQKSLIHCHKLSELGKSNENSFTFNPRFITNQRSTGFIIIDDERLLILISGIESTNIVNMPIPYIMSVIVLDKTRGIFSDEINDLIDKYRQVFTIYETASQLITFDIPAISERLKIKS